MAEQVIREARVNVRSEDVTLEGHLAIPEEVRGVVVFAHGSGSSRHSPRNRRVAKRLNEARLATLLFDLLTEEEQASDQLSGTFRFDIPLLSRRLADAVDAVGRRPETSALKVGLFGASTGAAAALITASERPGEIAAVVSRGGRPDLALDALPHVQAPTLLLVGELDHGIIELNHRAYEQLRTEKRLDIVKGATHLFEEPGALDAVADQAAQWFARYLAVNPIPLANARAEGNPAGPQGPSKREIIQAIIDEEEEPWIIMKPSRYHPRDPDTLCIFENPAEHTRARVDIPLEWFQERNLERIKQAIRQSLRQPEPA